MREYFYPTHRHIKTGGYYELLSDCATIEADMTPAVIYRAADGRLWVRPRDEFFDGRFERASMTVEELLRGLEALGGAVK